MLQNAFKSYTEYCSLLKFKKSLKLPNILLMKLENVASIMQHLSRHLILLLPISE